ncbi:class I SAM-dependent methyltransferase [Candidatus Litorirhabdus singularis]|nr:methyltransferase [Candidatus Litorirhabdus singularis]
MNLMRLTTICLLACTAAVHADNRKLAEVLTAQPAETQTRYYFRHPAETLSWLGIEPGMTVMEALPGGGWYSKILLDYLGPDGHLVGVDYNQSMFPKFGFVSAERIKAKETWAADWTADAQSWGGAESASISAFTFGTMPDSFHGKADAVLLVRALHNLARFRADGYLDTALKDSVAALKPGGILGVVQHEAREDKDDAWASGPRGYLKKSFVIEQMQAAGLEYVGSNNINQNPADQPGADDMVWRLPPSLSTSREDPELRVQMQSIGESNRMTLKFRKPK